MADILQQTNQNMSNKEFRPQGEESSFPMFSKATSLVFNSGNIVASHRAKRKVSLISNEEVIDSINTVLSAWLPVANRSEIQVNNFKVTSLMKFQY